MFRMVLDTMKNKRLPIALFEANTCLLLKAAKVETNPASYQPITLLNYDQKVITKSWPQNWLSKFHQLYNYIRLVLYPIAYHEQCSSAFKYIMLNL